MQDQPGAKAWGSSSAVRWSSSQSKAAVLLGLAPQALTARLLHLDAGSPGASRIEQISCSAPAAAASIHVISDNGLDAKGQQHACLAHYDASATEMKLVAVVKKAPSIIHEDHEKVIENQIPS